MTPNIDPRLLAAIEAGSCVAFVGAGFSAAAGLPQWTDLIRLVADDLPDSTRDPDRALVEALLNQHPSPSSRELEMAAQLLLDALGEDAFRARLRAALHKDPLPETMRLRLKHLQGIPFRAIVTTNFDPLLPGMPPSSDAYRRLLRSRRPAPWREAIARVALDPSPPGWTPPDAESITLQLHGRLDVADSLVLTRSQYRRRLYADPAYLTVLRSLLATSTVLFLGYSLTDAYLNELRAELVEAFTGRGHSDEPLAWAVIEGVSEVARRYYERHEGLGVVTYHKGDSGHDHSGFDAILKAIYDQTNPVHRLGTLLSGRRVLWFDPNPANNNTGRDLLRAAASECRECAERFQERFVEVTTLEEAWARLSGAAPFDLVISHWGHGLCDGRANGEELLRRVARLRGAGTPVAPLVIFAGGGAHAAINRRHALGLGAAELVSRWEDLFAVLERVLAPTCAGMGQGVCDEVRRS
jgi:CheY-like chemotaxis protein